MVVPAMKGKLDVASLAPFSIESEPTFIEALLRHANATTASHILPHVLQNPDALPKVLALLGEDRLLALCRIAPARVGALTAMVEGGLVPSGQSMNTEA
jgi:hypothetical protein